MNKLLAAICQVGLVGVMVGMGPISMCSDGQIVIQVVDGRNGKPIPREHVLVFQGATAEDIRALNSHADLQTDANGVALLTIEDPSISLILVSVDWHIVCEEKPNTKTYSIEEIKRTGLSTQNKCGLLVRKNEPDHFVVFARPAHFWEKMRY
jgi:hypothetical protein